MAGLTIAEVAARTGMTAHTLRYYERIGLLAPIGRAASGHRRYTAEEVRWVELLGKLHVSGMSIRRMQAFARAKRRGDLAGRRAILDDHRRELEVKVAALRGALRSVRAKLATYARHA